MIWGSTVMPVIENSHLYNLHEMQHLTVTPLRVMAHAGMHFHKSPLNPLAYTGDFGRSFAATFEMVERLTRRYPKPEFGIKHTTVNGQTVKIKEEVVLSKPFCNVLRFKKDMKDRGPKMLIVAPMSGHHATLLRGTVEALLPHMDVYITDWLDAKEVPTSEGNFDLDDYISYVIEFYRALGPDVHTLAVCQPSVPVLCAISIMSARKDPKVPRSMTLIGGPIDTRISSTKVNETATERSMHWFESNVITRVPFNHPGFMRRVYPGFLQLSGFVSMNLDRHMGEHMKMFKHLIEGDGESAAAHRKFYNEYLSVADLPADFYLQTIDRVFQRHLLPKGEFMYRDMRVDPSAITKTALLTLEGELDDISGVGQTKAAQKLCSSLPAKKKKHHMEKKVGHYGIFNGRRFRENVVPIIADFVKANNK